MDAREIAVGSKSTRAWVCSICNTVWFDQVVAELCCGPGRCEHCEAPTPAGFHLCERCSEINHVAAEELCFQDADKVWYGDYEEPYIYWSRPNGKGSFFRSRTELEAFCASQKLTPPRWVWACAPLAFLVDAEHILDASRDSQQREVRHLVSDEQIEQLQRLLDEWAMGLELKSYDADYDRAVILDRSLFEAFREATP